tara:strand:- start:7072 stop:8277 length:1206 start_codon:yes stop_codon:yes gene_type:complete
MGPTKPAKTRAPSTPVAAKPADSLPQRATRDAQSATVTEIVLLGGLGDVGMRLVRMLLEYTNADVTTVSRRSTTASSQHNTRLHHVARDLSGSATLETSVGAITVNLTEATNPAFAKHIVKSDGWFLETSATPKYLDAIKAALDGEAGHGTAILCVGMAPGMTNLTAANILAIAPSTSQIDIGVEMGMGRHYGVAATEWFLQTAGRSYPVMLDHTLHQIAPAELKRRFSFGIGCQTRPSVGYGFAEQTWIAAKSDRRLKTVRSFVALDPVWMTRGLAMSLALGLGPAISRNARKLAKWLQRFPSVGSTQSRLVVEGFDDANQLTGQIRIATGDQAEATAAMIFATIKSILKRHEPSDRRLTTITDHLHLNEAIENLQQFLPDTKLSVKLGDGIPDQHVLSK